MAIYSEMDQDRTLGIDNRTDEYHQSEGVTQMKAIQLMLDVITIIGPQNSFSRVISFE